MADATTFYAFDAAGMAAIKRDHQRLRETPRNRLPREGWNNNTDLGIITQTGITTTNQAFPTYPTSGNTFVVQLETWTFAETPGSTTVSYDTHQQWVVARTEDNSYIKQNTHVTIFKQRGRPGRRWWIRPVTDEWLKAVVTQTGGIQPNSSGLVKVWLNGMQTQRTEYAWLNWMHKDQAVANGKQVVIKWFADENKWVILLSECP